MIANSDPCLICRTEPYRYTGYCAACQVRMLVRQGRKALAGEELRRIADSRGREFAEAVRAQAVAQHARYSPKKAAA